MIFVSILSKASRQAVELLFPPRCAICGSGGSFLCSDCEESLTRAELPRCGVCWQQSAREVCPKCARDQPAFDGLRAPYLFQGGARELVHGLKYEHLSALAEPMAELLYRFVEIERLPVNVVVPVPLFPRRRRIRGYNQSALLAQGLARRMELPVDDRALVRTRSTASQAKTQSADQRRVNVGDAFQCRSRHLAGKQVLLIDDVSTTGATLDACARVLRGTGVASVWALTFARED